LQAAAKTGIHLVIASPRGYQPKASVFAEAREDAQATGAQLSIVEDPGDAVERADAVYTDVWASMGQEMEAPLRRAVFGRYQVNRYRMARAKLDALFLHCLPAHRGEEVTSEVLDGPRSIVFDQAENRLHVAKAVLLALFGGGHE
ncbi:MAG: ornithine carbamoyltransferase, partial [Acidobacteria bacterium]|nr:ornithine carbamoyltransferase [Acidobacteriota bacterium]